MRAKIIVAGVSIAALLGAAACTTTDPYRSAPQRNNTGTGAIAGAVGGALLGYLTNTSNGEQGRKNALIGAGIGALGGAAVGRYMDNQQRALESQLSGSGVGVARQGDNLVLRMPSDVTFATNQSSIDARFMPVLDDVAQVLQQYDQSTIDVLGYTDSSGGDAINQPLSERRAASVKSGLVANGVPDGSISTDGRGFSEPLVATGPGVKEPQNRRATIDLTGSGM